MGKLASLLADIIGGSFHLLSESIGLVLQVLGLAFIGLFKLDWRILLVMIVIAGIALFRRNRRKNAELRAAQIDTSST